MKKYIYLILLSIGIVCAETLFEVKDSANNPVLKVSDDGIAVMNHADTIMVISTTEIKAVINDSTKALSRKFSVSTTSAKRGLYTDLFDVTMGSATMRESGGNKYTDFSPENIFLGLNAGSQTIPSGTEGKNNVFVGNNAGFSNGSGRSNIFIGDLAGYSNTGWHFNTFVGSSAGYNSNGSDNTFVGCSAGYSNTSGQSNAIFGDFAGAMNVTGNHNSIFGHASGIYLTAGNDNTFMGYYSGRGASSGGSDSHYNCLFGSESGRDVTGDSNVMIGRQSGLSNLSGSGNVFLGNQAGYGETGSSKLYIANSSTNTPLIYGDFSTNNVGLGTNAPGTNRLKVINSGSGIAGAAGYFENSNTTGIGLAAFATSTDVALYAEQKNSTSTTANIAKFASAYGGWSEKMTIRSTGRIYTHYLGSGTGTALYFTPGNEIVKYSSSKKYKKDIIPLSVDQEKFMNLRPVRFKWNEKSSSENKADYGLIAEDVEKIDPELALYNDKGEIEGVDYQKINIMLLKVVQNQENKISGLEKENENIKKELAEIKMILKKQE